MRSARSSLVRPLSLRACSIAIRQHRIIPALRLKHRSGGSPRQEPPQAAVALRSASLRLGVRHGICVAKMLDNVGLRYPHRASGAKAPRTLRPLPLLRFAVSATGGAHLCSTKYYLRFWLSSCRTSLAVSALRIMRYCHKSKIRHYPLLPRSASRSLRVSMSRSSAAGVGSRRIACGWARSTALPPLPSGR